MFPAQERRKFVLENYGRIVSVGGKLRAQLDEDIPSLEYDIDAMLPQDVQKSDEGSADFIHRMSEADCRKALLVSSKLLIRYRRAFPFLQNDSQLHEAGQNYFLREVAQYTAFATELSAKVDRLEDELQKAQKELLEKQEDASAVNDQISQLASRLQQLAGLHAAKKNARTPVTNRLDRSLAALKQKLECFEGSNVSQSDFEAREKEIAALKTENTRLLENVRDVQADRQRAVEDNESLCEQLRKLRAEKQADEAGKKKKNK